MNLEITDVPLRGAVAETANVPIFYKGISAYEQWILDGNRHKG